MGSGNQLNKMKIQVPKFWLQATDSFEDGAPQREEFLTDKHFKHACDVYKQEWRDKYFHEGTCKNHDCPQCFP